jgi:hypothetical protein
MASGIHFTARRTAAYTGARPYDMNSLAVRAVAVAPVVTLTTSPLAVRSTNDTGDTGVPLARVSATWVVNAATVCEAATLLKLLEFEPIENVGDTEQAVTTLISHRMPVMNIIRAAVGGMTIVLAITVRSMTGLAKNCASPRYPPTGATGIPNGIAAADRSPADDEVATGMPPPGGTGSTTRPPSGRESG